MIIDSWVDRLRTAGGPGSGNFGHAGRPGEVGGSGPGGGGSVEIHSLRTATRASEIMRSDIPDLNRAEIDTYLPLVSPDEVLKNADLMNAIETTLSGYSPEERKIIESKVLIGATHDPSGAASTLVSKTSPRALIAFNTRITVDDLIKQVIDKPEFTTTSKTYWDFKKAHPNDEVGAKRILYQSVFEHELGHVIDRLIHRDHAIGQSPSNVLAQVILEESVKRGFGNEYYSDTAKRMDLIKTTLSDYAVQGGPVEAFAEAYQASRVGKLDPIYHDVMKQFTFQKQKAKVFDVPDPKLKAAAAGDAWEQWLQRHPDDLIELDIVDGKVIRTLEEVKTLGGPGSGNFGHAGRPGQVGGSAPSGVELNKTDAAIALAFNVFSDLISGAASPEMEYIEDGERLLRMRDTEMAIIYQGEPPRATYTYTMNHAGAVFLPKPSSAEGRKLREAIITHNHPVPAGLPPNTDISFSLADLKTAVSRNLREIRAVTPNGTFSLKRLGKTWPKGITQYTAERWESSFVDPVDDVAGFFNYVWQRGVARQFANDVRYSFTPKGS